DRAGIVAADLEARDDEIGPFESRALIGEGFDRRRHAQRPDELARYDLALGEPAGIDVHEGNTRTGKRLPLQKVTDNVLHEHRRAGADEGDAWIAHDPPAAARRPWHGARGRAAPALPGTSGPAVVV